MKEDRKSALGFGVIVAFVIMALFAPYIAPYDPKGTSPLVNTPPSWQHLLGTTYLGEDVLSQVIWGSRISLLIGTAAAASATMIGATVGLIAGYSSKRSVDGSLMRFTDVFLIIPTLPLMIIFAAFLGPTIYNIIFVISITSWPSIARVVRSQVLAIKQRTFVKAARVAGLSESKIMTSVILPNVGPLILANATLAITSSIVAEAGLDFLGLGAPDVVSWGTMLYWAQSFGFFYGAWWWFLAPGISIALLGFGFALMGFTLEKMANPRLRA
jgi:ABC-type dipeptide/oligopeptide/nickel transport system permease subunit